MTRHPARQRPRPVFGSLRVHRLAALAFALWLTSFIASLATARGAESAGDADNQIVAPASAKESSPTATATAALAKGASQRSTACTTFRVRPQDQVWVVSTRCLGCPSGANQAPAWQMWKYEKGWWQPKTAAEFYAADAAEMVTPFFIHGNRIDHPQACQDGLDVYFQLVGKLDDEAPARFVIWSWPSSQIKHPLRDVRAKATRSDIDAYYLGRFLADMKPEVPVGLVGYSFGARIGSGALELTSGGTLLGWRFEPAPRPQVRVAMWAAAEHNHWYLPGNVHGQALAAADAWFITINCCDPVLARYYLLDKCSHPVAVGYAGIYGRNLLPSDVNDRIEEVNVTNIVGGTHAMHPYLYSLYIQNRTRDYVMWHELAAKKPQEAVALATAQ
jgi:hypothetical protein